MEAVIVNAGALRQVLEALMGPPHLIRELQAMNDFEFAKNDPIGTLVKEFNEALELSGE